MWDAGLSALRKSKMERKEKFAKFHLFFMSLKVMKCNRRECFIIFEQNEKSHAHRAHLCREMHVVSLLLFTSRNVNSARANG